MTYVHGRILYLTLVDLKSTNMLLKWPKYCAHRMKKNIDITLKMVYSRIYKIYIILKTNEYF